MRAGDRLAQPVRISDNGFAFGGEFVNQRTNAPFVVAVGALKICDLGAQHSLQLAGAGEGALDAVAHGGDFTANGL